MSNRNSVSRFILAASAVALAACTDAPNGGITAPADAAFRSDVAQDRLAALFAKASPAVLAIGGTVFGDNDEVNHRLVFGVENERVIPAVRTVLAQLGAPTSDYEIRVTAPIYQVATLQNVVMRPTQAGVQIHFGNYLCSLGFNADAGTERSMITASHCTNTQGGVEGTQYYQPLSSASGVIATEVDDPEYFNFKTDPKCPRGKLCRYSDASRARYSADVLSDRAIAKTTGENNGSLEVTGSFTVTSQGDVGTGATVNKVGRTTGWTQGQVTNTCVNTNVSGSRIHQLCQTFVSAGVGGGDSGSGVFTISGTDVKLVGILWGGSSDGSMFVYSPLSAVEKELGPLTAH